MGGLLLKIVLTNCSGRRLLVEHDKQMLRSPSLSCWKQLLEDLKINTPNMDLISLFVFDLLHNIYLETSKIAKVCLLDYFSSDRLGKNLYKL